MGGTNVVRTAAANCNPGTRTLPRRHCLADTRQPMHPSTHGLQAAGFNGVLGPVARRVHPPGASRRLLPPVVRALRASVGRHQHMHVHTSMHALVARTIAALPLRPCCATWRPLAAGTTRRVSVAVTSCTTTMPVASPSRCPPRPCPPARWTAPRLCTLHACTCPIAARRPWTRASATPCASTATPACGPSPPAASAWRRIPPRTCASRSSTAPAASRTRRRAPALRLRSAARAPTTTATW